MVAANAATSSIWEKGRKYLIMVLAPVDSAAIGALDLAARNDLKKLAIINQDALLPKAVANTTNELAKNKSLDVVAFETYPTGTKDFSAILEKVRDAAPDLLIAAAVRLDDHVAIIREMKRINLDTKMVSSLPYGLLPEFYQQLGKDAEFVYSATFWEASLPNPGNREFVAAYQKEFNRAPAVQSANSYAGCQIFAEAVRHAGTTDSEKLREALLTLKTKTILGDFVVDQRGFQTGQKAVTIQWQDGKQAVVWPDGLGASPRFPTRIGPAVKPRQARCRISRHAGLKLRCPQYPESGQNQRRSVCPLTSDSVEKLKNETTTKSRGTTVDADFPQCNAHCGACGGRPLGFALTMRSPT